MLRILGFLFLVVIVAAGIAGGVWFHQDRQARQFVENANSRIYANWNTDTLFRNMASDSRSPDRDAWAREFFPMMSEALGPLESSETPQGTLRYGRPAPAMPSGFFGKYTSSAKFRNGNAELEFVVIKENGTWRIAAYQVSSPAILEAMSKKALGKSSGPTWDRGPPDEESAVLVEAEEILRIMDSESPGDSWNRASLMLQQSISKRRFVAKLSACTRTPGTCKTANSKEWVSVSTAPTPRLRATTRSRISSPRIPGRRCAKDWASTSRKAAGSFPLTSGTGPRNRNSNIEAVCRP